MTGELPAARHVPGVSPGQRPEYTVKMLNEFKSAKGKWFNPEMYVRANMLVADEDVEAVATYLAHLK